MKIIRPKMTRPTYLALKKYILKDREKKKQGFMVFHDSYEKDHLF